MNNTISLEIEARTRSPPFSFLKPINPIETQSKRVKNILESHIISAVFVKSKDGKT